MFCVAFGLSMDYEVFLLSRIKEEHDRTDDNTQLGRHRARAHRPHRHRRGRAHQRRVHRVRDVGRRVHQAVRHRARARRAHGRVRDPGDAGARVHALAGEANWWAPKPLRRLYERIGIREEPEPAARPRRPAGRRRRCGSRSSSRRARAVTAARTRARRGEGELLREEILAAAEQLLDRDRRRGRGLDPGHRRRGRRHAAVDLPALPRQGRAASSRSASATSRSSTRCSRPAGASVDDPVESARRRGRAYVRFGLEQPGAVPHHVHGPDRRRPPARSHHRRRGGARSSTSSTRCSAPSRPADFRPVDPMLAATFLWTAMHGITSLLISLPDFPWPDVDALVDHVCDIQIRGLREPVPQSKESS